MIKQDFEDLEAAVMKEVVKRRGLGGYSTEAEGLLMDGEILLKIVRHMNEQMPRKK